jgi:hypothetical protein
MEVSSKKKTSLDLKNTYTTLRNAIAVLKKLKLE